MKVVVDLKKLKDAWRIVQRPCRKNSLQVCEHVLVRAYADLELKSSDLERWIDTSLPVIAIDKPGEVVIHSDRFREVLRTVTAPTLGLELVKNELIVTSGGSTFKLDAPFRLEDFPSWPVLEKNLDRFTVRPSVLLESIRSTFPFRSRNGGQLALSGVLWKFSQGLFRAVATDARRMVVAESPLESFAACTEEVAYIVSALGAEDILEALKSQKSSIDDIVIETDATNLCVKVGPHTLQSRLLQYTFPEYTRVLPHPNSLVNGVSFNRKFALSALKAARREPVQLVFCDDRLIVENAHCRTEGACELKDPGEYRYAFSPEYLIDWMEGSRGDTVEMKFQSTVDKSVVLEDPSRDGVSYVLMPVHLSAA